MPGNTPVLGRLERVDLRSIWRDEAGSFTPWLGTEENIALLSETIDIELEVEAQEKAVGPFRADILCKDTRTGDWVLIENQLERTDHIHLGQIITYAAGLKAVTIVWIAGRFTEEHRAAIDWLNEISGEGFNFFGLEVEAWRIGSSAPAPKFNVISRPNDWSKTVADGARQLATGELTENQQLKLDFWTGFHAYASEHARRIRPIRPMPYGWMTMSIGRTGFTLSAVASSYNNAKETYALDELRIEFGIGSPNDPHACISELQKDQSAIANGIELPLNWVSDPNKKSCWIFTRRDADLSKREAWPEYFRWLVEGLDRFHGVLQDRVKALDVTALNAPAEVPAPEIQDVT